MGTPTSSEFRDTSAVAKVLEAVRGHPGASPFVLGDVTGLCESDVFHATARLYGDDHAIYKRAGRWHAVPPPRRAIGPFDSPQRLAVIYQTGASTHSLEKAARNRAGALAELEPWLKIWAQQVGREVTVAATQEHVDAVAAASHFVDVSGDADDPLDGYQLDDETRLQHELAGVEFRDLIAELAEEGIVQRGYYAELLRADPGLAPDHVYYVNTHRAWSGLCVHRWPEWGAVAEPTHDALDVSFLNFVIGLVADDDATHGAVYILDLAVSGSPSANP